MIEEKQDDEYDSIRDARGKAQAYCTGKIQQCLTHRNDSGGTNSSVSRKVEANRLFSRPAYNTLNPSSEDGVLNGVLCTVY